MNVRARARLLLLAVLAGVLVLPALAGAGVAGLVAPPAPAITQPVQNAIVSASVTVSGTASSDAVSVEVIDMGLSLATVTVTGTAWTATVQLGSGVHQVVAKARDAAGNVSEPSPVRTFSVDADAPSVGIRRTPHAVLFNVILGDDPYTISGTAADAIAGVHRIELRYESLMSGDVFETTATCAACPAAGGTPVSWTDAPNLEPGFYSMTATAFDRVGNASTKEELIFFAG